MIRREGIFYCLIGPAGSGKTTLTDMLLAGNSLPGLTLSISATTRTPREEEKNGEDYYFISKDDFNNKIKNNEFFEWEEIHNNFYGTLKETLAAAIRSGADILFDIDIKGAFSIKRAYPQNTVIIFTAAPNLGDLKKRLINRGTNTAEIEIRMQTAQKEYKLCLQFKRLIDYILINKDLDDTFKNIKSIISAERNKTSRVTETDLEKLLS